MITVRAIKPFTRRGQMVNPGDCFEIPAEILPKLNGYVIETLAKVTSLRPHWRPTPRAWLENGELRITGVIPKLETEIRRLTADDSDLCEKLLDLHCESWRNRN